MAESVLITCDAESERIAWLELSTLFPSVEEDEWLDTGDAIEGAILLFQPGTSFNEFAEEIKRNAPVFIRHLAPVQVQIPLQATEEDLQSFLQALPTLLKDFDPTRTFAVQTRILGSGKLPYRKVVINETLSNEIERQTGATLDCRNPEQTLSILCTPTTGYLGLSNTDLNRSAWPGGKHRFKKEEEGISRAEFKLLEAMNIFPWSLPTQGKALDIGAAPGGWTRILADQGLQVDAVDPAELDPRLARNRQVRHHRLRIQEFFRQAGRYNVIVNDMKMDARASADLMLEAETFLKPGGIALMTLKMPKLGHTNKDAKKSLSMVQIDLERLAQRYEIVEARQLYHNRSEVTVALRSLIHP